MTPVELTAALAAIGWSKREVVRRLHCDTNLPSRWSLGREPIPPKVEEWLLQCARGIVAPPVNWRG